MQNITSDKTNRIFDKRIILFLISQNLSLFGSQVVGFAIIWHITLKTSSGTWLMLATLATMLPQILISLWGGVWADRYNRKSMIMLSDSFVALATLGLAGLYWAGFRQIWILIAISAARALGSGVQAPAVSAIYPQLVPAENLTRVQGVNQTLNSILMLLSPAVGGLLLGLMDISLAFMLDVVTASLAVGILMLIKVEPIKREVQQTSVFKELREGLKYTMGDPLLKRLVICYGISFFLLTPAIILTPLQVSRNFGSEVWKLTINEMIWTVGSLAGGLYISLKGDFENKLRMIALCLAAFGLLFALLGIAPNLPVYLAIMAVAGVFLPVLITSETVFVQERAREELLGRVFSILQIVSLSAMPLGMVIFGPMADIVSVDSILIGTGLILMLVALWYDLGNRRTAKILIDNDEAAKNLAL